MRKYFRLELLKKTTCDTEGIDGRIPKRFLKKYGQRTQAVLMRGKVESMVPFNP